MSVAGAHEFKPSFTTNNHKDHCRSGYDLGSLPGTWVEFLDLGRSQGWQLSQGAEVSVQNWVFRVSTLGISTMVPRTPELPYPRGPKCPSTSYVGFPYLES